MDKEAATAALRTLDEMLRQDGYGCVVVPEGAKLCVEIVAGQDACADCLVPPTVLEPMIRQMLVDAGLDGSGQIDLIYPSPLPDPGEEVV